MKNQNRISKPDGIKNIPATQAIPAQGRGAAIQFVPVTLLSRNGMKCEVEIEASCYKQCLSGPTETITIPAVVKAGRKPINLRTGDPDLDDFCRGLTAGECLKQAVICQQWHDAIVSAVRRHLGHPQPDWSRGCLSPRRLRTRLPREIYEKLRAFASRTGKSMAQVIRDAVDLQILRWKASGEPGAQ
jgi:hypothetical protein